MNEAYKVCFGVDLLELLKNNKFEDGKPRSVYPKCRLYVRVLEYAGVKKAELCKLK
jgi:hypothetical protein